MNNKGKTTPLMWIFGFLAVALVGGGILFFALPSMQKSTVNTGLNNVSTNTGAVACTSDNMIEKEFDLVDVYNSGTSASGVDLYFLDASGKETSSLSNADGNTKKFCPDEPVIIAGYDDDGSGSDYALAPETDMLDGKLDGRVNLGPAKDIASRTIRLKFLKEASFSSSVLNDTTQSNTTATINSSTAADWQDLAANETASMSMTVKANTSEAGLSVPGHVVICFDFNSSYISSIEVPGAESFTPSIHSVDDTNLNKSACYKVSVKDGENNTKLRDYGTVSVPFKVTAAQALGATDGLNTEEVTYDIYDEAWFLMKDSTIQPRFETDATTPAELGAAAGTGTIYMGK